MNFWTQIIGFNVTFGPMHILGLQGMSRRIDTYDSGFGFEFWNLVASIGAFIIALGIALFFVNVAVSRSFWKKAGMPNPGPDPWDARSLEWMTASPTPVHNFDEEIEVDSRDEFWHRKYGYDENQNVVRIAQASEVTQDGSNTNVHLPSPSYFPILLALSMPIISYGLIYSLWLCIPGGMLMVYSMVGWMFEHPDDPNASHDHHGGGYGGGGHDELPDGSPEAIEAGDEEELVGVGAGAAAETVVSAEVETEATDG